MRSCLSASVSAWLIGFCPPLESKDQLFVSAAMVLERLEGCKNSATAGEAWKNRRQSSVAHKTWLRLWRRLRLPFKRRRRAAAHRPIGRFPRTRAALRCEVRVEAQRHRD